MDTGTETVGLGGRRRYKTLAKKDVHDSKYKLLFFWLNVLLKWFHYQQKPQTDLCKAKLRPSRAQITAPAEAQWLSEVLGWKGFWDGLHTQNERGP